MYMHLLKAGKGKRWKRVLIWNRLSFVITLLNTRTYLWWNWEGCRGDIYLRMHNAQLPYHSDFDVAIPFLVLFYFTKEGMTNISFCPGIKKIYQFHTNLQFESLGNWIFTTLLYPRSVNLAVFIDFNLCRNTTFL